MFVFHHTRKAYLWVGAILRGPMTPDFSLLYNKLDWKAVNREYYFSRDLLFFKKKKEIICQFQFLIVNMMVLERFLQNTSE